jgi:hypothetical protein
LELADQKAKLFYLALLLVPGVGGIAKFLIQVLLKLAVLMFGFNMVFVELILN